MYDYMDNLDAPKKWFMANVDTILQTFGADHHIQKEDLFLGPCSRHLQPTSVCTDRGLQSLGPLRHPTMPSLSAIIILMGRCAQFPLVFLRCDDRVS